MFTNTSPFPDVNVWLALASKIHPQHVAAMHWAESFDDRTTFFLCRFTQMGLLRLLTNRSAMGEDALSQSEAWRALDQLLSFWGGVMLPEPDDVEMAFRRLTTRDEVSTKHWADGYLSAFAEGHGLRLSTFDKALARTTQAFLIP